MMNEGGFTSHAALVDSEHYPGDSVLETEIKLQGHVHGIPWSKKYLLLNGILRTMDIVRQEQYDIIHCHDNRSALLGLLIGKKMGLPIVRSLHGVIEFNLKFRIANAIDRILLKGFDRIIFGSNAMRRRFTSFPESRIVTIHNGISLDFLNDKVNPDEVRKRFWIGNDDVVITTVGRLHYEKGHVYLLDAAREVCRKAGKVKFLIVGEGPMETPLKDMTAGLSLNDHVVFAGFLPSIQKAFAISDLYIQPSTEESLPLTVLEAMASGLPVISSDVGGIGEAVVNGKTGMLVPPGDGKVLSEAILSLLHNHDNMERMGRAGRDKIFSEFSSDTFMEKHRELYTALVSKRHMRGIAA
jgi:glycosyltransferase involved in cell wall biosynthesis